MFGIRSPANKICRKPIKYNKTTRLPVQQSLTQHSSHGHGSTPTDDQGETSPKAVARPQQQHQHAWFLPALYAEIVFEASFLAGSIHPWRFSGTRHMYITNTTFFFWANDIYIYEWNMPHTHQYVVWIVLPCREVTTTEYVVGTLTIIIVAIKLYCFSLVFPRSFVFPTVSTSVI